MEERKEENSVLCVVGGGGGWKPVELCKILIRDVGFVVLVMYASTESLKEIRKGVWSLDIDSGLISMQMELTPGAGGGGV